MTEERLQILEYVLLYLDWIFAISKIRKNLNRNRNRFQSLIRPRIETYATLLQYLRREMFVPVVLFLSAKMVLTRVGLMHISVSLHHRKTKLVSKWRMKLKNKIFTETSVVPDKFNFRNFNLSGTTDGKARQPKRK